jgi:ATP adenylyltransferase
VCQPVEEVAVMKRIWATWRMKYILGDKTANCVFCEALLARDDAARYVLHRSAQSALMLNKYPYINGHMMVVPYQHTGDLLELDRETIGDMMQLTQRGLRMLRGAMNPHGFNVGMNLGQAAGAGIQDHVHIHIVPRWENDTNFMPILGEVRVIPESLDDTYSKLLAELRRLGPEA